LAGGLTNTVASWMLFHPYQPPRIGKRTIGFLQGAVPKNQARLAAAIGRTVGGRLLTEDDLTRTFAQPEFRRAFDERLAEFLDEVLHRERGSLRELLPEAVIPQVEGILEDLVDHVLERLEDYVGSERFEEMVDARAEELLEALADEPIGGILTPAREEALREAAETWLAEAVESDDFRQAVDDYLERAARRLLEPEQTFEEILPAGLVSSFERAIQGYLPLAIERLGSLLEDPATRARFEATLNDLFHRFLRDLKFHQRVVARLVVTEETVDRVLDTIEKEGAERLGELLQEPTVQSAMARGVNDAVVDFLRRPVSSVLGEPDSDNVIEARETLAEWAVSLARDPGTRAFLVEKLDQALDATSARTWGEITGRLPTRKITTGLVKAARSEPAGRLAREAATRLADGILDRRIGTPASWLPADGPRKIEAALGDPLWDWLQTQVPDVVQRLDVARRVEEKVLEFPTQRMEELVRRVTDRELRLIVRLGYLLGAIVGSALVGINALIG
ncbi:MAG TPA: DUF445 family protein, partial [Longimicrobiales bacterium]|nr:DUF445 family protein [Longimicrobiales bacterium]